jgi:hypothetical protein
MNRVIRLIKKDNVNVQVFEQLNCSSLFEMIALDNKYYLGQLSF